MTVVLRGLFEGAQYNSEAWAECAVYSRARTKQGCGVIKEIRYVYVIARAGVMFLMYFTSCTYSGS